MKKLLAMLLTLTLLLTMGTLSTLAEGVKLEMSIGGEAGEAAIAELKNLLAGFTEETGIEVELVEEGDDHEAIMKTRMASNNLPDLFSTHGWCVLRYGDYCMDLSNEEWVANMDPSIKAVMTNADGQILGCPLTQWTFAMVYDEAVFEEVGIDPADIVTWADLFDACQKLADAGKTPVVLPGKNNGLAGHLEMMNAFYAVDNSPYEAKEALLDGSFDFTEHTELLSIFAQIHDNGWTNEDIFTADSDTVQRYMGSGDYGIWLWSGPTYIASLCSSFPERSYGFIPTPAVDENSDNSVTVGEGTSFAIWKDTPHPEEAKALLNYLTRVDVLTAFVNVNGGLPGFTNIEVPDAISLNKYREGVARAKGNIQYTNFFDRAWLPSGMWNAMGEAMGTLMDGDVAADNLAEAAQVLQDAYESLT